MDLNRIEREIFIDAPQETVWGLVSKPAWWVGEQGPDHVTIDGNYAVATCKYGDFPVITVKKSAPDYLEYRWASSFPGKEPTEGKGTLVTFSLTSEKGGTWLRVVETGFAGLDATPIERRKFCEENNEGWAQMLNLIKSRAYIKNDLPKNGHDSHASDE